MTTMTEPAAIMRFDFEGHALEFQRMSGEWWANGDEAAEALGYADRRKVLNVYNSHKREFLATETTVLESRTVDGKRRPVRLFSPKGLEHLAILGRTPTCVRFRRWILDEVLGRLQSGIRFVTADQLEQFAARIRAESAAQLAALTEVVKSQAAQNAALAGAFNIQASAAGRLLSYIAHSEETRHALEQARDAANGQQKIPFPELEAPRSGQ